MAETGPVQTGRVAELRSWRSCRHGLWSARHRRPLRRARRRSHDLKSCCWRLRPPTVAVCTEPFGSAQKRRGRCR